MNPRHAVIGRFSLRARLTFLATVGAAVVLLAGALLLYRGLTARLDDAVTDELRIRISDIAAELASGREPVIPVGVVTQVVTPEGRVLTPSDAEPVLTRREVDRAAGERELVVDRAVTGIAGDARVVAHRLTLATGVDVYVVAAGSTAPIESARDQLAVVLGIAGPAMVLALAVTAWVLTGAALHPVEQMTERAATISLREPGERLPEPEGRDEIARLARHLNAMIDRIASTIAHERAFVDDASHELRTPLAVLRGELELARLEITEGRSPKDLIASVDSALEEADRLTRLTEHLLVLARADAGELHTPGALDLREVATRALDRLTLAHPASVTGPAAWTNLEPDSADRVLTNLLGNADRWTRSEILVTTGLDQDRVILTVLDDGPGFDPQVIDVAFDRFSRGGSARSRGRGGAGLGLPIVAALVRAADGEVRLGNGGALGGAWVEIRLPAAPPMTAP